jgi:peptidyl-prolyl cis-trans isomerase B (cyclophilin B)
MAILGLVFAFVFSPLGIVFSAIGLGQVKERGERGRGLAIAGLILSVVLLLLSVVAFFLLMAGILGAVNRAMVGDPEVVDAVQDPEGVRTACETIIPAMLAFEADMATVTTPDEYAAVIRDTRATIEAAVATASDPVFVGDVQVLSDDLRLASDVVAGGEDPNYLMGTLTDDATRVDETCRAVGYTD